MSRNIDRLFDIWQGLHEEDSDPNTFVVKRQNNMGTFATEAGGDEDINTELYPFRPDVTSWYKSSQARRTQPFGYTYPETADLTYPTPQAQRTELMIKIGDIYTPLAKSIRQSKKDIPTAGAGLLLQANVIGQIVNKELPATTEQLQDIVSKLPSDKALLEKSQGPKKPYLRDLAPDNKYLEWITNIKSEKHALDGSYSVHIFLGPPEETNVELWPVSPTHVGTFAPLGQPKTTHCIRCQDGQRGHTEVTGQIPLTVALVERYLAGIIPDLTPTTVVPYLREQLHWRIAKVRICSF